MILNTYDSLVLKFECKKLLTKLRNFNLLQKRNIIINNIFKFSLRIRKYNYTANILQEQYLIKTGNNESR